MMQLGYLMLYPLHAVAMKWCRYLMLQLPSVMLH